MSENLSSNSIKKLLGLHDILDQDLVGKMGDLEAGAYTRPLLSST